MDGRAIGVFDSGVGGLTVLHELLVTLPHEDVVYLEIGDRAGGDTVVYPDDDIAADQDSAGNWRFSHKSGEPY